MDKKTESKLAKALQTLSDRLGEVENLIKSSPGLSANLAEETTAKLAEQEQKINDLETSVASKEAEIAELGELLADTPATLDDFPAEDRAAYFQEWVASLSPEDKATLAETIGPLTSAPATLEATPKEHESKPKTKFVIRK